jgi:hypothetical protein
MAGFYCCFEQKPVSRQNANVEGENPSHYTDMIIIK